MRAALVLSRLALLAAISTCARAQDTGGDPFGSMQWPELRRQFLGRDALVVFDDAHVRVEGPAFAEDSMNVPISITVTGLADVEQITVIVDRNPIRKVLDYFPVGALPRLSLRFKLEQASPVRAAVKTRDGVWHLGGALVDASGGGCTAPGQTRSDGSWARTLGDVSARLFARPAAADEAASLRLRLRVMHPMDTGLVGGVPAFYLNQLSLRDADGREMMRLNSFEPISENPIFSFDFDPAAPLATPLRLTGTDNNGNRVERLIE